jgi:hypothetical protein
MGDEKLVLCRPARVFAGQHHEGAGMRQARFAAHQGKLHQCGRRQASADRTSRGQSMDAQIDHGIIIGCRLQPWTACQKSFPLWLFPVFCPRALHLKRKIAGVN